MIEGTKIEIIDRDGPVRGKWIRSTSDGVILQQDKTFMVVKWEKYNEKGKKYRNIKNVKIVGEIEKTIPEINWELFEKRSR